MLAYYKNLKITDMKTSTRLGSGLSSGLTVKLKTTFKNLPRTNTLAYRAMKVTCIENDTWNGNFKQRRHHRRPGQPDESGDWLRQRL